MFAFLWAATAAVVITLALMVSIARLLLPLLDHYRIQIEQFASSQVGRPVLIGEVSAGWQGLHPDLRLRDVRILAEDGHSTWLSMNEVRASLDMFASARHRRLETGQISLVGGSLDVVRHDDGSFSVAGVATGFGGVAGVGGRGLLQWLMARDRVYLEGATLRWHDGRISKQSLEISQLSLDLRRIGDRYRLGGAGQLTGVADGALRFALDLSGDPERPDTLRSSMYVDGQLVLGPWLDGTAFAKVRQLGGALDFQLWADGADRLERLRAVLEGRELLWQPDIPEQQGGPVAAVRLDQASGTLFWRQRDDGWRLGLEQLQIVRDHRQWPQTGLDLSVSEVSAGDGVRWEFTAPFLRLQDINAALLTVPDLPADIRKAAAELAPAGDVRDVALRYDPSQARDGLYIAARFEDLSVRQWSQVPGIEGIDGVLRMNREQGFLSLDSRNVGFTYPRLFREVLQAQTVSGQLFWYPGSEGVRLYSPKFAAANDDVRAEGRVTLDFPASSASPFLDLAVDFRDGNVARARHYLPTGIMPDGVVGWLDRALVSGHVPSGRAVYFGRLADFPYADDSGTFRIDFGVEDLMLDYAKDWPPLQQGAAEITFSDQSMRAQIGMGNMRGLEIGRSRLVIDNLGRNAVLDLDAQARAPLQALFSYLASGPLRDEAPPILEQVRAQNMARTAVALQLPLRDPEQAKLEGTVDFSDNSLEWAPWNVRFEQLRGQLGFAYRSGAVSYDADDLQLRWRSAPASMTVRTSEVGNETQVQLNLQTRNDAAKLLGDNFSRLDTVLRGSAEWELRATIHQPKRGDKPVSVDVQVQSDLRGIEVTLPPPLRKSIDEERSILVTAGVSAQGVDAVRLYYGSVLNGVFALKDAELHRGELRLGPAQATLPGEPGLRVAGFTERLSVSDWKRWADSSTTSDKGTGGWVDDLNAIDVRIGALEIMGQVLHQTHLAAQGSGQRWVADVNAREMEGRLRFSLVEGSTEPVVADLKRLRLAAAAEDDERDESTATDPSVLPALRIDIEQFAYGDLDLGKLALRADPVPRGMRVTQARIDGPSFRIDANGEWLVGPRGQISDFDIDAATDDLGEALERSGYAGTLDGGDATLQIEAQWPGSPAEFALRDLDGKVRLLIKDGQLLALDPRGGRIFGLLSLQALPRRLSLDFSDLFRRGFAFDRIQGAFTVADGDAYTNDLYMEGPAARIDIAGRIGLAAEDYDQTALVTPRISASIPVVGGLAGGPAVGLGLWVAERMFGKKIDELSRVRYNITGSWQDPVVTRMDDPD